MHEGIVRGLWLPGILTNVRGAARDDGRAHARRVDGCGRYDPSVPPAIGGMLRLIRRCASFAKQVSACSCSVGTRLGLYGAARDFWASRLRGGSGGGGGGAASKDTTSMFLGGLTGGALGCANHAPFCASTETVLPARLCLCMSLSVILSRRLLRPAAADARARAHATA